MYIATASTKWAQAESPELGAKCVLEDILNEGSASGIVFGAFALLHHCTAGQGARSVALMDEKHYKDSREQGRASFDENCSNVFFLMAYLRKSGN